MALGGVHKLQFTTVPTTPLCATLEPISFTSSLLSLWQPLTLQPMCVILLIDFWKSVPLLCAVERELSPVQSGVRHGDLERGALCLWHHARLFCILSFNSSITCWEQHWHHSLSEALRLQGVKHLTPSHRNRTECQGGLQPALMRAEEDWNSPGGSRNAWGRGAPTTSWLHTAPTEKPSRRPSSAAPGSLHSQQPVRSLRPCPQRDACWA